MQGAGAGFAAMGGPEGARDALFDGRSSCIDTGLLSGEQSRHCLAIDLRASAAPYDELGDTARVRYARVNAQGDTLTLAERGPGCYETPC